MAGPHLTNCRPHVVEPENTPDWMFVDPRSPEAVEKEAKPLVVS